MIERVGIDNGGFCIGVLNQLTVRADVLAAFQQVGGVTWFQVSVAHLKTPYPRA